MKKWLLFFLLAPSLAMAQQAYSPGDRPHAGSTSKNNSRLLGVPPQLILGAGPGENSGQIQFNGSTSGSVTLVPQAAAGTPTITFGTSSGTPAVTASSPLSITTATGNITCATCVTSSGGGAITGTAPVAVSAAGAVSITGAAGQVLAGSSPAFTATPTLGASGTPGTLALGNATSGTVTLGTVTGALGSVTASLPANTGTIAETNLAQTWSAIQTFGSGDFKLTSAGGGLTLFTPTSSASNFTLTFPAATDTVAVLGTAQTWTAVQTFNANDLLLGGVTGGGNQCLHASNTGVVTGTGSDCGAGGSGNSSGPYSVGTAITGTGTVASLNKTYCVNLSGAATLTLPASPSTGDRVVLKDCTGAMTATVTATVQSNSTPSSYNIDAQATFVMNTAYQENGFWFNGTIWSAE
jgi:hypothetical protein